MKGDGLNMKNKNLTRELIFDMDGTIADLYGVPDWLPKLRAEDATPYRDARPLYDMDSLNSIIWIFKKMGYHISVVSWGAMGASAEYDRLVKREKIKWLRKYEFPYDEIYVVPYGTPKSDFIANEFSVLLDDSLEVRNDFVHSSSGYQKIAIDATENIISQLVKMLVA